MLHTRKAFGAKCLIILDNADGCFLVLDLGQLMKKQCNKEITS